MYIAAGACNLLPVDINTAVKIVGLVFIAWERNLAHSLFSKVWLRRGDLVFVDPAKVQQVFGILLDLVRVVITLALETA